MYKRACINIRNWYMPIFYLIRFCSHIPDFLLQNQTIVFYGNHQYSHLIFAINYLIIIIVTANLTAYKLLFPPMKRCQIDQKPER